jgi:hypothetical protein
MAGRSIGELNVKISGNAQQLIHELNRAQAGVAGGVSKIDRELGQLQRSLGRKFTVSDIGKDIVKGLGIGSGFALAEQAAELLVSHWRNAAEEAKAVEQSTARQLAIVEKIIAARQSPEQQAATAWKKERAAMREFQDLQTEAATGWSTKLSGVMGGSIVGSVIDKLVGTANQADVQAALTEWQSAYEQFLNARGRADEAQAKTAEQSIQHSFQQIDRLNKELGQIEADVAADAQKRLQAYWDEDAALQKKADALLDTIDPMREYRRELELITELEGRRKLTPDQAKTLKDTRQAKVVDEKLTEFFGPLDEQSAANFDKMQEQQAAKAEKVARAGEQVGWAFTSAFEDAILSGGKLSDVLENLGQDILRIALRTAITAPLGQMIGGAFAGMFSGIFGGFFADGGRPPMGKVSVVGENGPELFVPDSAGTIVPNSSSMGGRSGALGGNTYIIDARGADQGAVARIEKTLMMLAGPGVVERRAWAAVQDRNARMA